MDPRILIKLISNVLQSSVMRFRLENGEKLEPSIKALHKILKDLAQEVKNLKQEKLDISLNGVETITLHGKDGHTPTDEELLELIRPLVPDPIPGEDGDTPTEEQLLALIKPLIPKVKDGKTPTKPELRALIRPLIPDPIPGKTPTKEELIEIITPLIPQVRDGSPDTAEQVRDKLSSLEGDEKLSYKALKDLPKPDWGGGGPRRLNALTDTLIINPANGDILVYNSARRVWENTPNSGSGVDNFLDLTDTPDVYTGSEQYFVKVNAAGTGLEFVAGSGLAVAWGDITGTLSDQTDLQTALDGKQPLDSDLTTIAGLTATTDNFIQSKAGAWASRTIAQVKTDLGLAGTNSGDQTSIVGITGTKAQFDTAVTDGNILYVGDITQYTDELAQDAVGTILTDSSEIDFTYNDGGPTITASIVAGSIDETKLDASVNTSLDSADSALQPGDIASGTITPRNDDINFSGGSDGDVLTVQADGSLALEANTGGAGISEELAIAYSVSL